MHEVYSWFMSLARTHASKNRVNDVKTQILFLRVVSMFMLCLAKSTMVVS